MEWQPQARAEMLLEVIQERLGELPSETATKILGTADLRPENLVSPDETGGLTTHRAARAMRRAFAFR